MVVQHVGWLEEVLRSACVLNKSDGHLGASEDPSETLGFAALWERSAGMSRSSGDISRIKGRASLQKVTPQSGCLRDFQIGFPENAGGYILGMFGDFAGNLPQLFAPSLAS